VSLGFCKAFALSACTLALATAPLLAGALDDAARRRVQLENDALSLRSAEIAVSPAAAGMGTRYRLSANDQMVAIRNSTLRELVALAYGVNMMDVNGGVWLDSSRYDIHVQLRDPVADPANFDPSALRGVVNKLLASRFDLQIHVNQRCQEPCGRYEPGAHPLF
jgi:hypothetical protein